MEQKPPNVVHPKMGWRGSESNRSKIYEIQSYVHNIRFSSLCDMCLRMNLKARVTHVLCFEIRSEHVSHDELGLVLFT
jgi:hypothetical protein